ncbi:MAG: virulence protein RhuM/Fic/DOC family protein [Brachymonas sp.]|nr:virulence protein RhuM/Fic/DOC family protein [Brachymonas sp.]
MKHPIEIYRGADGQAQVEVRFGQETVWLSLQQMADLFGRDKSVISRHLKNIFAEGELERDSVVAKNATVQMEGKRQVSREIEYYNLDAILSVGYRVNSKAGTQFRIWATARLKDYLLKGYALNHQRLQQNAAELAQSVFGEAAYPSVESKAAHLLYFVVKNHPFTDGNKRSGAFLFVDFLNRNGRLLNACGQPIINDTGLAALTLLVAESDPQQKEVLIRLVMHMLHRPD